MKILATKQNIQRRLFATKQNIQHFIGFETSKEYCDIANQRINGAVLSFNS